MRRRVQTREEVLNLLAGHSEEIMRFGVKRMGVFGSFAREDHKEGSDVDILVEFLPAKKTFRNFIELVYLLEDLLQREVELVTPESLSPYLKPYVFKQISYVEALS